MAAIRRPLDRLQMTDNQDCERQPLKLGGFLASDTSTRHHGLLVHEHLTSQEIFEFPQAPDLSRASGTNG